MGEYFKEEQQRKEEKQEELITDLNDLFAAYTILVNKIQETTTQGYEAILPIRSELVGGRSTPDDIGQIGKLRRRIENSRIYRMELGMMMYNTLNSIEDLDKWSERYSEYLEKHIDGMKLIAKSAFKIIIAMQEKIRGLNSEIKRLESSIIMRTQPPLKPEPIEEKKPRRKTFKSIDEKFVSLLEEKLVDYIKAERSKDEAKIMEAKDKLFAIIEDDEKKQHFANWENHIIKINKIIKSKRINKSKESNRSKEINNFNNQEVKMEKKDRKTITFILDMILYNDYKKY